MFTYEYTTPEKGYKKSAQNTTSVDYLDSRPGSIFYLYPDEIAWFPRQNKNLSGFPIPFRKFLIIIKFQG